MVKYAMNEQPQNPVAIPPKRLRYFFWLILACLSAFFGETTVATTPYPFFSFWGLLVILPLYGLHTLVLAAIVYNYGRPRLATLYLAGVIFGLYEAYITKILWEPQFWDPMLTLGGVAVFEVIVIAFWWRPFMSFILPVLIGETAFTHSFQALAGMPQPFQQALTDRRRMRDHLIGSALLLGLLHSANSSSAFDSVLSILSSVAVLFLLGYLWRRWSHGVTYDMRRLLPNRRETFRLGIALLIVYLLLGLNIRKEAIPDLTAQAIIWVIYFVVIAALILNIRKSRTIEPSGPLMTRPLALALPELILTAILFTLTSVLARSLMGDFCLNFIEPACVLGGLLGLWTLYYSIRTLTSSDSA